MKTFDIRVDINHDTYEDEFVLYICENNAKQAFPLSVDELLDLYHELKHTVETNIG